MIDYENYVFSSVATALRAKFTNIFLSTDFAAIPPSFPAVMGTEVDNSTFRRSLDSSAVENHARVLWQWEVVSNLVSGRKAQCKEILAEIDSQMQSLGFVRMGSSPAVIPYEGSSRYRMVARYRGTISSSGTIYRG